MQNDKHIELAEWIKSRALELGFSGCGVAKAEYLQGERLRLENWLISGYNGEMEYMAGNVEKRLDPAQLVPGAKSVIVLLMNYFPDETLPEKDNYKIAKYAYGKDYHDVIKEKLHQLIKELSVQAGPFQARAFTDSAPVLERAWAEKAGLGWIGKNTCLIHPKTGSFAFIAEIITDLELEYDRNHINDLCGGCTRCIEYCPTGAIIAPRILDSRKCISYLTIEYRGAMPQGEKEKFGDWIFGCDICQDVCPWNKKSQPHREEAFKPSAELREMRKVNFHGMTQDDFNRIFKGSAVKRTRFEGLKRNIDFLFMTFILSIILLLPAGAFSIPTDIFNPRIDTLPPPPPPGPVSEITGPDLACVGEISEYFIEVPVACSCQWSIAGILQPETGSTLSIMWTQPGIHEISVVFSCSGGLMSDPIFKTVMIHYQPDVFLGNDTTIMQGQFLELDAGNPGLFYSWSTGETTQTITVSSEGEYSVTVHGYCGNDSDTIEVSVAIGIEEFSGPDDCFSISSRKGMIILPGVPENTVKIQIIATSGSMFYEGKPVKELSVAGPGIYLIRMITRDGICTKKIFVP